jgi:hypothetical protein
MPRKPTVAHRQTDPKSAHPERPGVSLRRRIPPVNRLNHLQSREFPPSKRTRPAQRRSGPSQVRLS